jgi:hypothetical protein
MVGPTGSNSRRIARHLLFVYLFMKPEQHELDGVSNYICYTL